MNVTVDIGDGARIAEGPGGYRALCALCSYRQGGAPSHAQARAALKQHRGSLRHRRQVRLVQLAARREGG